MKTFKLVSLQVVEGEELHDIPLVDGLIINKEDEHNTWLIESFIDSKFFDLFKEVSDKEQELLIQVVISKKENSPAPFKVKIRSMQVLDNHMSILFEGTLKKSTHDYAGLLLHDLIEKGLTGDQLLSEFKEQIQSRPKIATMRE